MSVEVRINREGKVNICLKVGEDDDGACAQKGVEVVVTSVRK